MHPVLRTASGRRKCSLAAAIALLTLTGCQEPEPRLFADFMEDPIAREGTLARCNRERETTEDDLECANARRAAAAIALREERERAAAREAQALAEANARAAYDAQWRDRDGAQAVGADGLPLPDTGATPMLGPAEFGTDSGSVDEIQDRTSGEPDTGETVSASADAQAPL
jgi:hypothetical protein